MKKILFVIDHLGQGGAQKMLYELCKGLRGRGYTVHVVSLLPAGLYSPLFPAADIPLWHGSISLQGSPLDFFAMTKSVLGTAPQMAKTFAGLTKEIKLLRPHLITTFLFGADVFGTVAGRLAQVKVVNAVRATNVWKRPWHKLLSAACYPFVDHFTANATSTRTFMTHHEGVPADKIRVIPNGVMLPKPIDNPAQLRQRFRIPAQHRWLVAAGRLDPQKGFSDLIRAMATLTATAHPPCILSIFGDGPQKAELHQLITTLQLQDTVRLEGYHAPIDPILQAADIFVLSSIYEGMPNVVLEAMAAKTPVIATDIDGVQDIISDRVNGLLVPPGQPERLTKALRTLLDHDELRQQLAERGFADVAERFTIATMVDGYHRLFQELTAS